MIIQILRRKQILFFLLLFNCAIIHGQEKIVKFYNVAHQEIDKKEFLEYQNSQQYRDIYFENDSSVVGLLVRIKNLGKLNQEQFKQLNHNLDTNKKKEDFMVIIYYPGKDKCNGSERKSGWNVFNRDYLKNLNKIGSYSHYWIYKNDENLKYYYPKKINWTKDKNQFIEKTFFKYHFPCFSFVVIDNEGNYISKFGEFGKQEVWEISRELVNKNYKQ